jgi:hypothetical protein
VVLEASTDFCAAIFAARIIARGKSARDGYHGTHLALFELRDFEHTYRR